MQLNNAIACNPFWYIFLKLQLSVIFRWFKTYNLRSFHKYFFVFKLFWIGKKASLPSPGVYTPTLAQKINQRRRVYNTNEEKYASEAKEEKLKGIYVREVVKSEPNLEFKCSVGAQEEIPKFLEFDKCCGLVVFDHEITGLGRKSDITQFAACGGVESFENYVIPRCNITSEASSSRRTKLTYCRESNSLYSHGKALYGELVQNLSPFYSQRKILFS